PARSGSITVSGRIGEPEDVADVVGFLAGPQGCWVTGRIIDVSGGTYLGPSRAGDPPPGQVPGR
ncbi:hypothetical protein ACFQ87_43675, partial [Kitasatospora sp. NPDC056531]